MRRTYSLSESAFLAVELTDEFIHIADEAQQKIGVADKERTKRSAKIDEKIYSPILSMQFRTTQQSNAVLVVSHSTPIRFSILKASPKSIDSFSVANDACVRRWKRIDLHTTTRIVTLRLQS